MSDPDTRLFTLTGPAGEVIMRGSMSAVTEQILDTPARAEAEELLIDAARACGLIEDIAQREQALRQDSVQRLFDGIATINRRMDTFVEHRQFMAREAADEEARRIQSMLDALPSPDDPDPALHGHTPTGDLSPLPPTQHPVIEDQGDLPNELKKGAPPLTGTDPEPDPAKLAHPQAGTRQVAQPIAIEE